MCRLLFRAAKRKVRSMPSVARETKIIFVSLYVMYRFHLSLSASDGFKTETAQTVCLPRNDTREKRAEKKQDALTGIQLF